MADFYDGSINFGEKTRGNSASDKVARAVVDTIESPFKTEDNPYYEMNQNIMKIVSVASLATGTYNQQSAAHAIDKMDFENDKYLQKIGYSTSDSNQVAGAVELNNTLQNSSFTASMDASSNIQSGQDGMTARLLSSEEASQIKSTGQYTVSNSLGDITYNAAMNADGTASLTSSTPTFDNVSHLSININPTQGIEYTAGLDVNKSSLSAKELSSLSSQAQSFTRGGVTYTNNGEANGIMSLQATVKAGSNEYQSLMRSINMPTNAATVSTNGFAFDRSTLDKGNSSGVYDLGGLKFNVVPMVDKNKMPVSFADVYTKQRSAVDNQCADVSRTYASSSYKSKQQQLAQIQTAGVQYINAQAKNLNLDTSFDGSSSSLSRARRNVDSALKKAIKDGVGDSTIKGLKDQQKLLDDYAKHGGNVQAPTQNRMGHRGLMTVGNTLLGRDMMNSIQMYTGTARAIKGIARGTTGISKKFGYMGVSTATSLVRKGMGLAGKTNCGVDVKLQGVQERAKSGYAHQKAKDRARANGTMKQFRANERASKRASKGAKLLEKRDKLKMRGASQERIERVQRRIDRHTKYSERRSKVNKFLATNKLLHPINALKNSKLGKSKFGKATGFLIKAPGKAVSALLSIPGLINKLLTKLKIMAVKLYLGIFAGLLATMAVVYLFTQWWSGFADGVSETVNKLNMALNDGENYQQLIIDITTRDIATDFTQICQIDATDHYLSKKVIPSENFPWYLDVTMGKVNHIWAWEEADDTSRYAKDKNDEGTRNDAGVLVYSGDLMYPAVAEEDRDKETGYLPAADRTSISSITLNMYPIAAMTHKRYYDDLTFEEWETALGYTYYMFSVSHDIARYDSNYTAGTQRAKYGDYSDDPGYDYEINYESDNDIYGSDTAITWDPKTHTLTRPVEQCSNVYIHDFSPVGYTSIYENDNSDAKPTCSSYYIHAPSASAKYSSASTYSYKCASGSGPSGLIGSAVTGFRNAKGYLAKKVAELLRKPSLVDTITADSLDKGYTDTNDLMSLELKKRALKNIERNDTTIDGHLNMTIAQQALNNPVILNIKPANSGIFLCEYSGGKILESSLPHAQPEETYEGSKLNGLGTVCNNIKYFCYGEQTNADDHCPDIGDNAENVDVSAYNMDTEGGNCTHLHTDKCFIADHCTEGQNTGYLGDTIEIHTGRYTYDSQGGEHEIIDHHTHTLACCTLNCGHHHTAWTDENNPGDYKTVAVCGGHCGGHLQPLIDVVEKVTYKGLADEDNFKTTYWLTAEEVTNAAGGSFNGMIGWLDSLLEDNIVSVNQFRQYWYAKASTWFVPIPRSPWGYYKKMTEHGIQQAVEFLDNPSAYCKNFFAKTSSLLNPTDPSKEKLRGQYDCGLIQGEIDPKTKQPHSHSACGCKLNPDYNPNTVADDDKATDNFTDDSADTATDGDDLRAWTGWWKSPTEFDTTLNDELCANFGSWEEDRLTRAPIEWSSYGESGVEFPQVGIANKQYTIKEIAKILSEALGGEVQFDDNGNIITNMTGLPDNIITALKWALTKVGGLYSQKLRGVGLNCPFYDCSSFATSICLAAGFEIPGPCNTTEYFYGKGHSNYTIQAGMFLTWRENGEGHVVTVVGQNPDGTWKVVAASNTKSGITLKDIPESTLKATYSHGITISELQSNP